MFFSEKHEKSIFPKMMIVSFFLSSIVISGYLMFAQEANMIQWLKTYKVKGNVFRHIILLACFIIYFVRILCTLFIFYQRKMFWKEAFIIMNIMPWIFPYLVVLGGNNNQPIGEIEYLGILLFLFGSYLNTFSEYLRHQWKLKAENIGKLYTKGLFKYSIHINYFGDIVLFFGLVLIARQAVLLIVPTSMALFFIGVLIPLKERYLRNKYGIAFKEYARITKKLIPCFY